MKSRLVAATALAACLVSSVALGQGFDWLRMSPVSQYDDEDWEMLYAAAGEVLENGTAGVTAEWSNPRTGNSGSISVIDSFERNGRPCHSTRFMNRTATLSGSGIFVLCKVEDGTWKLVR